MTTRKRIRWGFYFETKELSREIGGGVSEFWTEELVSYREKGTAQFEIMMLRSMPEKYRNITDEPFEVREP